VIAVLGKPKHEWASEDIASLRGMASQLRDGQATPEHLFPPIAAKEERPKEATPKEETKVKRGRAPKAEAPVTAAPPTSLLPRAATEEDLEAIRLTCLDKGIDIELILQQWQVSRLEELDGASAQQVREWMESHYPSLPIQQGLGCHRSLIQVRLGPAAGGAGWPPGLNLLLAVFLLYFQES
jgi:hypothetical protein